MKKFILLMLILDFVRNIHCICFILTIKFDYFKLLFKFVYFISKKLLKISLIFLFYMWKGNVLLDTWIFYKRLKSSCDDVICYWWFFFFFFLPMGSKHCNTKGKCMWITMGTMFKNKPHLVTFFESMLVSLWAFKLTLIFWNFFFL